MKTCPLYSAFSKSELSKTGSGMAAVETKTSRTTVFVRTKEEADVLVKKGKHVRFYLLPVRSKEAMFFLRVISELRLVPGRNLHGFQNDWRARRSSRLDFMPRDSPRKQIALQSVLGQTFYPTCICRGDGGRRLCTDGWGKLAHTDTVLGVALCR